MSNVSDLEAQLAKAKADEAETAEKPHKTLGEILHELATTVGRTHLHEDIDALDKDKTPADDDGEVKVEPTRIAPVGKEEENA